MSEEITIEVDDEDWVRQVLAELDSCDAEPMSAVHGQLEDFHRLIGQPIGDVARPDVMVDMELRVRLMAEEFDELLEALEPGKEGVVLHAVEEWIVERRVARNALGSDACEPDIPAVADALADLEYVTIGSAVTWGIPGGPVWEEVHAANMRKGGGPKDPVTGKALKPPGWRGPDIEGVLARAKAGAR